MSIQNKIKVIFVINRFPGYGFGGGGAERKLENLVTNFLKDHKDVIPLIYVSHSPDDIADVSDLKESKYNLKKYIRSWKDYDLEMLLKENGPNTILHLFDSTLLLYQPKIFKEVCSKWLGPIIQRITLLQRVQQLIDAHSTDLKEYVQRINYFISQTEEITLALLEAGITDDKIAHIDYGIDKNVFFPVESIGYKQSLRSHIFPWLKLDRLAFLFVGRLTDPNKRVNELISAWNESGLGKSGHLLVLAGQNRLGDAPSDDPFVEKIESIGLGIPNSENILCTGLLTERQLAEFYRASDVFILPSVQEALSYSVLEAMASGLPVICRRGTSGNSRVVVEGKTGYYFDSEHNLKSRLIEASSSMNRKAIGDNALEYVRANYVIEKTSKNYIELYKKLLKS